MSEPVFYLDNFRFQCHPPSWGVAPDYHVEIGVDRYDEFGNPDPRLSGAMTPEQAAAKGFPLEAVIQGINQTAIDECLRLRAQVASLQAQLDAMQAAQAGGA